MTSSNSNDDDDAIKNQVRDALRSQKVKLWTPPYVNDEGEPLPSALEHLAKAWKTNGILQVDNENPVIRALQEWQQHALEKLKSKAQSPAKNTTDNSIINLEIKILGRKGEAPAETKNDGEFCQRISTDNSKKTLILIALKGVSALKTDVDLLEFLKQFFPSAAGSTINLRLIHRGKNLSASNMPLKHLLQASLRVNNTVPLLCLVSTVDPAEQERANLQARIQAIRQAALQIRDSTKLEITDQHGKTVPMTKEDRLGFLTALALHRLGLNCASQQEALVLLLEADVEWNRHPNLNVWKDRVDNYGLLQLDIAWIYLQLESLSNLPDSLKRLEEAERVLRKQVHKNFVTLALAQAEMGNSKEVPPLAAVFAKLKLLQGIAYLCDCKENPNPSSAQKSQERLDQAFALLQCLRSMTPEESVQQLLEVMGGSASAYSGGRQYTASDAIAALRKCQGDMDQAASAMTEEETKRRQRQHDREVQHQHGLCQNETDPVDLAHLETLKPLLKGGGASDSWALETTNTDLAVGLLRLSNNDLTRALELYAEQGYDAHKVHALVDSLDQKLVRHGLLGRAVLREKKKKRKLYCDAIAPQQQPVDDMALVTLVSMGVENSKAEAALKKNGNDIEKAMVWLSTDGATELEDSVRNSAATGHEKQDDDEQSDKTPSLGDSERGGDGEVKDSHGDGGEDAANQLRAMEWEAQQLLHRELGDILEERDLEKEYLGKDLNEEWQLVLKYR